MAQTSTVPETVNNTALDLMSASHGKVEVAHWFLTANTDRNPQKAVEYIGLAIADLVRAKDAITTSEARELRRPVDVTEQLEADL